MLTGPCQTFQFAIPPPVPDNAGMPHWISLGDYIAGRVIAGLLGFLCLYMAFFLFEDEEGKWQNKLDGFWVSVDDRAKVVDRTSTALFNQIGRKLISACDLIFGERRVSVRAVATSVNLSLAGVLIIAMFGFAETKDFLGDVIDPIAIAFFVVPILALLGLIALTIHFRKWWALVIASIPIGVLLLAIVTDVQWGDNDKASLTAIVVFFSVLTDCIVIALVRRLFAKMSTTVTFKGIVFRLSVLITMSIAVIAIPAIVALHDALTLNLGMLTSLGVILAMFNITTSVFCLIPLFMLLFVLAHKLVWPSLSRVIYPLCRYKIVTNKKALKTVGVLCITYAFNLSPVGWKDILHLL